MRVLALLALVLALGAAHADELRRAGFLGVQIGPDPKGLSIRGLLDEGSAKNAGLREGDVITSINGETVKTPPEFVAAVSKLRDGDVATIEFLREGQPGTVRAEIRPRPTESSPGAETRYLSVEINGERRRLIVTVPRTPGRHPAVLYMTGIGCFSQESLGIQTTEAKLLYGLTDAGFVTMRVEKSGIGDSEGASCNAPTYNLHTEVAGYVAGLLTLRGYDFVQPDNVFLLGLSIGGVEAPLVAHQAPVKGVVVVNTVARPFLDYLHNVRRHQLVVTHSAYDDLEDKLKESDRCNQGLLVERKDPEALLAGDPACAPHIAFPAPAAYMREWTAIVPAKEWKLVDAPVLIVTGEMDYVAFPPDAPYLRDMIESFHPGHATLVTIPGMTHYLTHVATMQESVDKGSNAPFEPRVLETVREWLRRTAAG